MLPHLTLACSFLLSCALFVLPMADRDRLMAGTTPAATPGSILPADQLILRVEEGESYVVLETVAGEALVDESYILQDGEAVVEGLPEDVLASYREQGFQDIYAYFTNLTADDGESAVTISIRVYILEDEVAAEAAVESAFDTVVELSETNPDGGQDIARLDSMPAHDEAIEGWSVTHQYANINTGEDPFDVPGFRFVAQVGAAMASAEVYGSDDSVSVELAEYLLMAQIACLQADEPCQAIPFPGAIADDAPPKLGRLPGADSQRRAGKSRTP